MTPAELIALTENNTNRIRDVFPHTDQEERNKSLRHYLYVTLLRPEVSHRLLPFVRHDLARSRLQRYIRAELSNVLGPNGDRFNANSTRELYDEFIVVLQQRIRTLKERKRGQNKNSNESTTHSPRPARRTVTRVPRPAPVATAPVPQVTGRRRAASNSPPQAVSPANSDEGITLLLGDLNNLAIDRRRQRRRVVQQAPTVPAQLTVRQQAALDAAAHRASEETAERQRIEAATVAARQHRREAPQRRAAVNQISDLIGNFAL
jgi:hypothetical protein